jgi:hypothetical protein
MWPASTSARPVRPTLDAETLGVGASGRGWACAPVSCLDGLEVKYVLPVRGDGRNQ